MESEPTDTREPVSTKNFFLRLRQLYPINLIYYPGSGRDTKLFKAFEKHEVVLLDDDGLNDWDKTHQGDWTNRGLTGLYYTMQREPFVFADYRQAPFRDEVFDVVFINCNYTDESGFRDMLRTLRVGGLVIFGDIFLNHFPDEDLDRLEEVKLPFRNIEASKFRPFLVAQKVK